MFNNKNPKKLYDGQWALPIILGLVFPEELSLLFSLFILLAISPTLFNALAALLILMEGLLGVTAGDGVADSFISLIGSVEGEMEDLLEDGLLLLANKLVSDFFLSSIIFLCIFPTNLDPIIDFSKIVSNSVSLQCIRFLVPKQISRLRN